MKRRVIFLLAFVLTVLGTLIFSTPGFSQPPTPPGVEQLRRDASSKLEITWNSRTGTPSFIRGRIPLVAASLGSEDDPVTLTFAFLDRYADVFGIRQASDEMNPVQVDADALGMIHVTLGQAYQGIQVYDAYVKVHLNADVQEVVAISSSFVPDIRLPDTQPRMDADWALAVARRALTSGTLVSGPKLVVYPGTGETPGASARLAWLVELGDDSIPVRNVYVVDAIEGIVLDVLDRLFSQSSNSEPLPGSEAVFASLAVQSGPQCDPQAYYGVQHCTDDNGDTHIIVVDLNDPHVRVQTVLSSGPNGECNSVNHNGKDASSNCPSPYPFETVESMLDRYRASGAVAIINTDYFGQDGDHGAEGLAVRNGQRLDGVEHGDTDGNATVRSSLALSSTNEAMIGKPDDEAQIDTSGVYYNVVAGGPTIVRAGQALDNSACNEDYLSLDHCTSVAQSSAGLTVDGQLVLITAKKNAADVASYLTANYQVHSALKFDGGGSAHLAWLDSDGQIQSYGATDEDRAVAEGLLIFSAKISGADCLVGQYKAEYFNNRTLDGNPDLERCEGTPIAYAWGYGGPGNGLGNDNFSVRWTGRFDFTDDTYNFAARTDDGIRVWVDDTLIIDAWWDQPPTSYQASHDLAAGEHEVKVEYYEHGGEAVAHVRWWGSTSDSDDGRIIASDEVLWGTIEPSDDTDLYYFDATQEQVATIRMEKSSFTPSLDPFLVLYAPDGSEVARDDDGGGDRNALISRVPLYQDGRYRIEAQSYAGSSTGLYSLSLTLQQPGQPSRETYDANHGYSLPGTLVRSEGDGPTGDEDVDNAHDFAGATYDYYWDTHHRDSYDDQGATLVSTANYGYSYMNAFWNGRQVVYGDGFPVMDVVAHELAHAVTEHSADLEYRWQSGALSESFSDIFGTMVDRDDWLMGEDLPPHVLGGREAIRDLSDPPRFGQPDHTDDWVETCSDNEGVHTNSGIPNKAYYNIATAIGKEKAELIFYRVLAVYLQPSSSLEDARAAALQSAEDLYGSGSDEYDEARDGFNAVGLDGQWNPPTNNCICVVLTVLADESVYSDRLSAVEVATTLYRVRDQLLSTTASGQHYRVLYERHTGRISHLLLLDPALRATGGEILRGVAPGLSQLMDGQGNESVVTQEMVSEAISFLRRLAEEDRARGGGELAQTIEQEMARIDWDLLVGMTFEEAWTYIDSCITFHPYTVYLPLVLR